MDQHQPVTSAMHYVQMVPVGSVSSMPGSIQSLQSNEQMMIYEPASQFVDVSQNVTTNSSAPLMMPGTNYSGVQQLTIPNNESGDVGAVFSKLKPQTSPMPVKRKSPMENMSAHLLSPREVMPAKKTGLLEVEHRPWLNVYSPNQSNAQHQVQSLAGVLASQWATKKRRTTQFQPGPFKSGFLKFSTLRSLPIQGHASPRVQNESNETVRIKLRESIGAALALVTETDISLCAKDTSSTRAVAVVPEQMQEASQSAEFASSVADAQLSVGKPKVANDNCSTESEQNMKCQLTALPSNVNDSSLFQIHETVHDEFNVNDMLPDEESIAGSFFVKDDLLQGNGLSWVLDFDAWVAEKEGHELEKQRVGELVDGAQEVKKINSPQTLALQIELELFKLFDGVNKKYKEKGRSLLFNLKDKNNPELREKVMSGEISPARLCSMTAEELASKELSEWRIAKAEEFEHMKILPDSDIDIRRLVKKTHKGEYQVEVEEDDVSVEVSVGSSSLARIPTKTTESKSPSGQILDGSQMEAVNNTNNSGEQKQCAATIPSNSSGDIMQGIVEDEFKDAEFLPPIVSLDEFMESLHKEPPFENLSADSNKIEASLDNAPSEAPQATKSSELFSDGNRGAIAKNRHKADSRDPKLDTGTKQTDNQLEADVSTPVAASKGEQIWEGILQLSNSSKISVGGFFKSGEKASTKDWPRTIEIKGRVRLDAFEKFLHDLHKSRSRAVMVMHLILKKGEGKESESLNQVADSYASDDRVGYAEPVRGLEAYLCPCHPKITDRIVKHLGKEQSKVLSFADGDKGLIGVLIWRKAHAPPNTSSRQKSFKKHQQEERGTSSGRRHNHQQDKNMVVKSSNLKPKQPSVPSGSPKVSRSLPKEAAVVEDDVPPGFSKPASQEDDDLPEFNFSSGLSRSVITQKPIVPQTQNRPSDQIRQLIQKYGQNAGSSLVVEPWEDDDDDDIPEWQPPQPPLPQAPQSVQQNYQPRSQPVLQHLINHQQHVLRSPLQQAQAAIHPQLPKPTSQQKITHSWQDQQQQQQQQTSSWMNHQGPHRGQFYGSQSSRGL